MNHQHQLTQNNGSRVRLARVVSFGFVCWMMLCVSLFCACAHVPSAHTTSREYGHGQSPVDPATCIEGKPAYDDFASGGQLFKMHCGSCHNARALGERPFNETEVSFAHMRRHAYLTGKEYRQLIHFLRRWHDLEPPTPDF